jgi:hypothetical protein
VFTFRGTTPDFVDLRKRVLDLLAARNAMHIGELRMRLGVEVETLGSVLEAMRESGEIKRLRPMGYTRDDHDFFRVNRPADLRGAAGGRWVSEAEHCAPEHARLASEVMAGIVG